MYIIACYTCCIKVKHEAKVGSLSLFVVVVVVVVVFNQIIIRVAPVLPDKLYYINDIDNIIAIYNSLLASLVVPNSATFRHLRPIGICITKRRKVIISIFSSVLASVQNILKYLLIIISGVSCLVSHWQQLCIQKSIREIPDHATFRGKGVNTGLVRQAWGLSLFGPM